VAERVLSREELAIASEDDVVVVRRAVRAVAERRRFDAFAMAALTTAASELSRNAWVHGGGGRVVLEELLDDRGRAGVRLAFRDEGKGIDDVDRVMAGGYSTGGSLGLGLSGSRRLVDEMRIDTTPGGGTTVTVTKWQRY
jgi:serine/threonine-protein kinase RsbT